MKRLLQKLVAFWQRKGVFQPKRVSRRKGLGAGFTLIELLVAALIASLLVSVLLSFLVGVLDSDRKETAKSNAQEELQAAISYISDDLQESIYIYGSESLAAINSQLPHTQTLGATTQCDNTNCTPILVFWKRFSYNPNSLATYSNPAAEPQTVKIGCMPYRDQAACNAATNAFGRDTYTYSLVAYYLKSDSANTSSTWSNTARILRWELKDGYVAYCSTGEAISSTNANCPETTKQTTRAVNISVNNSAVSPAIKDTTNYFIVPDKGFNRPDFASSGSLSVLASAWKKFDNFNFSTNPFVTLVDFMDDTAYAANQGRDNDAGTGSSATAAGGIKISIGKNVTKTTSGVTYTTNPDCDDPSIGVGNANPASASNVSGNVTQRIPANFSDATNPSGLSSFYACVTPESVTARIFLRGNAIARLATPTINRDLRKPNTNNITFFPNADVRSFGRSAVGLKKK